MSLLTGGEKSPVSAREELAGLIRIFDSGSLSPGVSHESEFAHDLVISEFSTLDLIINNRYLGTAEEEFDISLNRIRGACEKPTTQTPTRDYSIGRYVANVSVGAMGFQDPKMLSEAVIISNYGASRIVNNYLQLALKQILTPGTVNELNSTLDPDRITELIGSDFEQSGILF